MAVQYLDLLFLRYWVWTCVKWSQHSKSSVTSRTCRSLQELLTVRACVASTAPFSSAWSSWAICPFFKPKLYLVNILCFGCSFQSLSIVLGLGCSVGFGTWDGTQSLRPRIVDYSATELCALPFSPFTPVRILTSNCFVQLDIASPSPKRKT